MSTVLFFQFLTDIIDVVIAQNMFDNRLLFSLPRLALDISPQQVLAIGAYDLIGSFHENELLRVKKAYIIDLRAAWALSIAICEGSFVITFLSE